jgi:hypothetical protein
VRVWHGSGAVGACVVRSESSVGAGPGVGARRG